MYRIKDLQDCIFGLIGFRQNDNPDYPTLSPSLVASASGLYVQDEHPLLCIENIDQAVKNYDHFPFDTWSAIGVWQTGEKVRYSNGKVYESLIENNLNKIPPASTDEWIEIDLLSQKLDSVLRAAGGKVIASIFEQKKIDGSTKSIIESVQIFGGNGAIIDKEIKTGRFVGYAIGINKQRDLTAVIRRIGTQFSHANPDLDIYIFHSSQEDPIKVFNLALAKAGSFEWSRLVDSDGGDYILRYTSEDHESGGYFYIGYYEDELTGQAINKEYNFASPPTCGSCSDDYTYYQEWSKYFDIVPFYVSAGYLVGLLPGDPAGAKLWDLRTMQATYTRTYGLNLDLSILCDVTDFLCRERSILSNALMKQVSVDILNLLAYSTRNTAITKETQSKAMHELNNKDNATPGAQKKLDNALKALSFDMSNLNSACIPCDNPKGPTWGSI